MRAFPSLSATWRRLSPRERRVVTAGALVGGLALLVMRGALPFAERWSAREAVLAAKNEQLARLRGAADDEARLRDLVADPLRVEAWRSRLGRTEGKLNVGIAWRGGSRSIR